MSLETYFKDTAPWLLEPYYKQALWAWLALPILFVSSFAVSILLVRAASYIVSLVIRRHRAFYERYVEPLRAPIQMWLGIVFFAMSTHLLPLTKATQNGLKFVVGSIAIYAIIWGLFVLVTNTSDSLRKRFLSKGKVSAASLIPLMRKLLKAFLAAMALLFLLQNWGFDVAALIAGLGIGGIAIALASQKSVENLFGGVSVTLDQPVRIGDFISFGDKSGTVEDIGLRSTTIRTPARTLITVPNSQFSEMQLENFAAREKLLFLKIINLRHGTTSQQVRHIVGRITDYFTSREDLEEGRARLINISTTSLDIEVFAYVMTLDGNRFLEIQEEIYLDIMDIVQAEGVQLAPSSTVYIEQGSQSEADSKKMHLVS